MHRRTISQVLLNAVAVLLLAGCGQRPAHTGEVDDAGNAAAPAPAKDEAALLNVYSWPDYIAPATVANFEHETGIKVNYTIFENDQALEAKMLLGDSHYDVVLPSGPYFARLLSIAGYRKLDKAQLTNYKNLDPVILKRMAAYDPGNQYAVPYMWSTTGLAYDLDKANQRTGGKIPDSWSLLFDTSLSAKFADCGIAIVDSPTEVFSIAILYLGHDPRKLDPDNLAAAAALLKRVRPYVRYVSSTRHLDDLAKGEICLALTWSGDAVVARDRARAAGRPGTLVFSIPKEGGLMAVDMMSIPANAPHPHNALLWFNYLMRPEVMAEISNAVKYPNGNAASLALINPDVRNDRAIYPDAATFDRLVSSIAASPEYSLIMRREWARFKSNYQ